MGKQKPRLGLKKETLLTLGGLDAAALARVVGGTGGTLGTTVSCLCDHTYHSGTATSLSGSRKC